MEVPILVLPPSRLFFYQCNMTTSSSFHSNIRHCSKVFKSRVLVFPLMNSINLCSFYCWIFLLNLFSSCSFPSAECERRTRRSSAERCFLEFLGFLVDLAGGVGLRLYVGMWQEWTVSRKRDSD